MTTKFERQKAAKMMEGLRKVLPYLHDKSKMSMDLQDDDIGYELRSASNYLRSAYREMKDTLKGTEAIKEEQLPLRQRTRQQITRKIDAIFGNIRTSVVGHVGKKGPMGTKSGTYVDLYVGWGWMKYVGNIFYRDDFKVLPDKWFILSAREVKVNDRLVRLFKAKVYDRSTDENRDAFIGMPKEGVKKAAIRFTAPAAVSAARELLSQETNRRMTYDASDEKEQ